MRGQLEVLPYLKDLQCTVSGFQCANSAIYTYIHTAQSYIGEFLKEISQLVHYQAFTLYTLQYMFKESLQLQENLMNYIMNVAHFEIKQTPAKKVLYDKYYFGLFYK